MTDEPTKYAEIPQAMRDLLDQIYTPEGVEIWWNARRWALDHKSADQMWHGYGTRNRVIAAVEYLTAERIHHNHMTRDIKPRGQCPACDEYHRCDKAGGVKR